MKEKNIKLVFLIGPFNLHWDLFMMMTALTRSNFLLAINYTAIFSDFSFDSIFSFHIFSFFIQCQRYLKPVSEFCLDFKFLKYAMTI